MNLLDEIRKKIADAIAKRDEHQRELDELLEGVEARGDGDMNDDEKAKFAELRTAIVAIDDETLPPLQERETELADVEKRRTAAAAIPRPANPAPVKVTAEARTYTPDAERREGVSFVRDVVAATFGGDFSARGRLERHMQEERVERGGIEQRDVGTGAFTGLVVPQYLTDLVAPKARAARPFADICRKHPLPAVGMTVNISRITTGTAVAVQATENTAVQETNADDTLLTVDVRTIAGQQDVSRQAIDRGVGIDEILVADLVAAYHAELDRGIMHDDGTSGTHLGLINVSGNITVAYTDASPTAAELYPKMADIIQQIQAGVFAGVTHFVMHPRRWWWIAKELGSTFPLLQIPGSGDRAGNVGGTDYRVQGGRDIFGVPVVLDGNIATNLGAGTNEDTIFAVTADECHLWEDPNAPLFMRAEQTGAANLTVKLVVYGYSAFTAGRYPTANGDISGTGLVTPTF